MENNLLANQFKKQIEFVFQPHSGYRKRKYTDYPINLTNGSTSIKFDIRDGILYVYLSSNGISKSLTVLSPYVITANKKKFRSFLFSPRRRKKVMRSF